MTPRNESVSRTAADAFVNHVLIPKVVEGEVRSWLVKAPGTGIYHFWVTILPRTIIVSGDIGDAILNVSSEDPLHWVRSVCGPERKTDYGYVASKIRTGERHTFDDRLAEEFLKELLVDADDEMKEKVKRIKESYHSDDDSGNSFFNACYHEDIDLEGAASDYPADRYWTVECLRTFARLLP